VPPSVSTQSEENNSGANDGSMEPSSSGSPSTTDNLTVASKKRRKRNTSFEPLANAEDNHRSAQIAITIPRKATPALKAARTEYRSALAERSTAQKALDSARKVVQEAQQKMSEAEGRSQHAEDHFHRARSLVEELTPQNPDVIWNEMLAKLEAFHQRHGHCRVKSVPEFASNPELGLKKLDTWMVKARAQYRKYLNGESKAYRPHRIVALERLGVFVGKWQEKYNNLLAFKEEHGHCNVPTRSYKDQKLGNWVGWQRSAYKKYKDGKDINPLSPERIKLLEDIGFSFNLHEEKGIVWKQRKGADAEEWEGAEFGNDC